MTAFKSFEPRMHHSIQAQIKWNQTIMAEIIISLSLITLTTILSGITLQIFSNTRIYKKEPYLLNDGFTRIRVDFFLRTLAFALVCLTPLYLWVELVALVRLELWIFIVSFFVIPLFFASLPNLELQLHEQSKLVISKPLFSTKVQLHLKKPYQAFDRQTYQELLKLVSILPQYGIEQVKLTSPMFYEHNGQLRNFQTLEKLLMRHNATLQHVPAKWFDCILGKIGMRLSRSPQKKTGLEKINTNQWQTVTIDLVPASLPRGHHAK